MADTVTQLLSPTLPRDRSVAPPPVAPLVREDPARDFLPRLPAFARRIFGLAPVASAAAPLPPPSYLGVPTRPLAPRGERRAAATDPRLDAAVQGPPVPPPPPPPMQRGETNSERVRELQALLRDVGLLKSEPDGDFGRTTERALLDFQSQYSGADGEQLPVTGVADPMTMRALRDYKAYVDEQRKNPRPRPPEELVEMEPNFDGIGAVQVLRLNATGPEVTRAQKMIRALGYDIEVTGVFDEPTRAAVADFQSLYTLAMGAQLEPDGVLGPNTGASMALAARRTRESPTNWLEYARRYRAEHPQPSPAPQPGLPQQPGPEPRPPVPPQVRTGPPLRQGSSDRAAVTELQNTLRALNYDITPDGDFGPATAAALTDFQRLYTMFTGDVLVADGVLGDSTRIALMSARQNRILDRLPEALRRGQVEVGYTRGTPTHIVVRALGDGTNGRLETRAAMAYYAMRAEAVQSGARFQAGSSFRTMQNQRDIARRYRDQPGRAATPGYSTHQSGIAIDTEEVNAAGDTWLRTNGRRFGFVLPGYRYTNRDGHSAVEHWHWEYRVDRLPNAARRFYGLPELTQDPLPTAPPAAPRRATRRQTRRAQR